MKSTFRILFYAKWEASDEAKMLPIYVRITINGTKARFSLKIRVSEKIWDAKSDEPSGIATRLCKPTATSIASLHASTPYIIACASRARL